jgi:dTDP-glucose 4,6-dehydratase
MKVVVTGGAGFIGSHLCELLIEKGYDVLCVDNFITGTKKNLADITSDRFSLITHNVSEPLYIDKKIDQVYHLASPASPVDYMKLPIQTLKVGALGTHNLLGLAKKHNAKFLLASTSEIYGNPRVNPQSEEYWGNVNPVGPRAVYDEAKRFAEALTIAYHKIHRMDTRIARIFNTYGERMRADDGRAVPTFICCALKNRPIPVFGDGSQTRSFCYISDMVAGLYALMGSDYKMPLNLGNPDEITILELANRVLGITGSKSKIVFKRLPQDDPVVRCPDITKAKKYLKWRPKESIDAGLKRTIKFFECFRSLATL